MEKHAFLIMAHESDVVLTALFQQIDHPRNDIYLHLDIKAGAVGELPPLKWSRLTLVPRKDIRWGGFSQVTCELALLAAAAPYNYQYYHLLSGADLLLKAQTDFHAFFDQWRGKEFIHFQHPLLSQENADRVRYYYFSGKHDKRLPIRFIKHGGKQLQRIFRVDRLKAVDFTMQKGSNWFSITHEFAEYVLGKHDWIRQTFHHTYAPDEFFLQTIAVNSPFQAKLFESDIADSCTANQRFVQWSARQMGPKIFTMQDVELLLNSDCLIARKFSAQDLGLITRILRHTKGTES